MPKVCEGENGKRNVSALGIGHITFCELRLEICAFDII